MKSYYLTTTDEQKIEEDFNAAFGKIDSLKPEFDKIISEMKSLEPQQEFFFLHKVLMDLFSKSELPWLHLNGILTEMADNIKPKFEEKVKVDYKPDYFG